MSDDTGQLAHQPQYQPEHQPEQKAYYTDAGHLLPHLHAAHPHARTPVRLYVGSRAEALIGWIPRRSPDPAAALCGLLRATADHLERLSQPRGHERGQER